MASGKPLNKEHPCIQNLSPTETEKFDALQRQKARRGGKLTDPNLKDKLSDLQSKIRDGDPIDENSPGFKENLTPNQQAEFKDLTKQDKKPLNLEEEMKLDNLKKQISGGLPLDVTHPGLDNLIPRQQEDLKKILDKSKQGQPLEPDEKKHLQNLQNLMQNGRPLDQTHPGYDKLTPKEQNDFDKLVDQKKRNGGNLQFKDTQDLDKLAAAIQLDQGPPSMTHRGVPNLSPEDKQKFEDILDKQKAYETLTPQEKEELRDLKDTIRPDVPYDEQHPNFDKLSPEEQRKLGVMSKKLKSGVPLSAREKPELT